jgi:hypothetical protein
VEQSNHDGTLLRDIRNEYSLKSSSYSTLDAGYGWCCSCRVFVYLEVLLHHTKVEYNDIEGNRGIAFYMGVCEYCSERK